MTGAEHQQPLTRGEHGVEELGPLLAAGVAVAHAGNRSDEVLRGGQAARAGVVVEAEQAHHRVGHPALGGERRHGDGAGAEAGPATATDEPGPHEHGQVGGVDLGGAGNAVDRGLRPQLLEEAFDGPPLPRLGVGHGTQVGECVGQRRAPPVDRAFGTEAVDGAVEAVDELGEGTGHRDVAALDHRMEGDVARAEARPGDRHGGADEQLVEAGPPGVDVEVGREPEGLVVGGAEPPAHVGGLGPLADAGERVGVEAEPQPDRRTGGEGDDRARPESALEQVEQRGCGVEDRVVLAEAAVGDPHGDGGHAVALVPGEHGLDQRGEPARVGAQHGDVARLEAGLAVGAVLLEQVEERVARSTSTWRAGP